jgi:hypothetical protein
MAKKKAAITKSVSEAEEEEIIHVSVYMTKGQREELKKRAADRGFTSLSSYLLDCSFTDGLLLKPDRQSLSVIEIQLRRLNWLLLTLLRRLHKIQPRTSIESLVTGLIEQSGQAIEAIKATLKLIERKGVHSNGKFP